MWVNTLFGILNLLTLVSILRYHSAKKEKVIGIVKKAEESLHPAFFRDRLMQQECCVICKGNTPRKPASYPKQVSAHQLCINRYKAGEIELKEVGQVLGNKQINLKEELALSYQRNDLKLIEVKDG